MEKGFNDVLFMRYMENQFPTAFAGDGSWYARSLVENLICYAHKHEQISKDQFCEFLSNLLPEIEMGEVAMFMDDCCLTESYGLAEKRRVMKEKCVADRSCG